jgi:hypothetical protein
MDGAYSAHRRKDMHEVFFGVANHSLILLHQLLKNGIQTFKMLQLLK